MKLEIILSIVTLLVAATIIGARYLLAARAAKQNQNTANPATSKTEAPSLTPFGNAYTFMILILCIGLIAVGIIVAIVGSLWGIAIGGLGILIWWAGDTKHEVDPRTAGVLTCWDAFIEEKNGGVVVGGRTILANYFPFFLSSTEVDMTNVDKEINMTVISSDDTPMEGFVSITLRPDAGDLIDYIQAGQMTNILTQINDMLYETTKYLAMQLSAEHIAKQSNLISDVLSKWISEQLPYKSFGVQVIKVKSRFSMPKRVIDSMEDQAKEKYDRLGELKEAATNLEIMEKYKNSIGVTAKEAWEEFKTARLIRDGRVARIDSSGKISSLILADQRLNMGENPNRRNT